MLPLTFAYMPCLGGYAWQVMVRQGVFKRYAPLLLVPPYLPKGRGDGPSLCMLLWLLLCLETPSLFCLCSGRGGEMSLSTLLWSPVYCVLFHMNETYSGAYCPNPMEEELQL